jgi:signal transduction histidine kinase
MDKNPLRVLLIEDDPDDHLLTRELLAEIPGSKVVLDWAKNFDEGLEAVGRCEHDAILLDYRLGQGDGLLLLREALRRGCKAPVILLTGAGDRELAMQALEAGAADYLVKSDLNALVLERAIRYALQQKRQESELEDKVAERTAALEAASRAKDDFLAALSHELRTPLNPALLLASALAEDETLPEAARHDLGVIAKGIALQAQLIDDLLDVTRITEGKLRLDLHPIDAHVAIHHAHEILKADISNNGIQFKLQLGAEEHTINADAVRVQQIFWNVLKNAIKFTPHGGTVKVRTRNPSGNGKVLEVEISDTGIGIEREMLPKIFDAFIQEEHDAGHRFGGVGLGLAITHRLVELQNGRIIAESEGRSRGATFRIELPLASASAVAIPAGNGRKPAARTQIARRILLVEDHEQTRATLTKLLERRGHNVLSVASTEEARERVAAGDCDLVISDLGLPDGDGHRLMLEMGRDYGLPGIALSGYGTDADIARSKASGFFAHLTKPVEIHSLESAIAGAPLGPAGNAAARR